MNGIDISSNQGKIDFTAVKNSGIDICYIKATEGISYTNPFFTEYHTNAKATGLKIGFYHYLRSDNPVSEAKHFLSIVNGLDADCKFAIDVEETFNQSSSTISSNLRQFADYLISQGKEVVIYTYSSFYKNNMNGTVADLPLWVADYTQGSPNINRSYIGWQHSSSGSVNGIIGHVDLDDFSNDIFIQGGPLTVADIQQIKQALNIPDATWAQPEIQKALQSGMINTNHDPNEIVTFGTFISIVNKLKDILNVPDSTWAAPEIDKALQRGLINSQHDPNELVAFGEVIALFNKIQDQIDLLKPPTPLK